MGLYCFVFVKIIAVRSLTFCQNSLNLVSFLIVSNVVTIIEAMHYPSDAESLGDCSA